MSDDADFGETFIFAQQLDPIHDVIGEHVKAKVGLLPRLRRSAFTDGAAIVAEHGDSLAGKPQAQRFEAVVLHAFLVAVPVGWSRTGNHDNHRERPRTGGQVKRSVQGSRWRLKLDAMFAFG